MKGVRFVGSSIVITRALATLAIAIALGGTCNITKALPLLDKIANTGGAAVKVFPDKDTAGKFWYMPVSVEPWSRNNSYKSQLYVSPDKSVLTFIFRGQASVDDPTLRKVAKALGVTVGDLSPIVYDKTQNLVCQNVFVGENLQWLWPSKIGGYLEVIPISLRTKDPALVPELNDLITGGGLGCTVDLTFRGIYTAYWFKMHAHLDTIYDKFQAAAHAEGFWWEVDINAMIETLKKEGAITFEKVEDANAPKTPLDDMVRTALDDIVKKIVVQLFTPALKLPTGDMTDRGKPWSLRVDWKHQETHQKYEVEVKSEQVAYKDSTIGIRMALSADQISIATQPIKLKSAPKTNKVHALEALQH